MTNEEFNETIRTFIISFLREKNISVSFNEDFDIFSHSYIITLTYHMPQMGEGLTNDNN